jgi:hypothetical protein
MGGRTHYVQSHRISSPHLGIAQERFDGIAEIWFDSAGDAASFNQDPVYKGQLAPDEPSFVDMRNVRFLVADEEILMSGPMVQNDANAEDLAWREQDRPVTIKLLQFFDPSERGWPADDDLAIGRAIGALRHVRCRPNPTVHEKGAFVSGIRELWWPTLSAFERGVSGDQSAWAALNSRGKGVTLLASTERHL